MTKRPSTSDDTSFFPHPDQTVLPLGSGSAKDKTKTSRHPKTGDIEKESSISVVSDDEISAGIVIDLHEADGEWW